MDAVQLARLQFAFTIGFHILWPTFTIGLASFIALLSGMWWRTGRTVYRDLMRFWLRIFALAFGMGVITGVVLSYEIGANWAGYSRAVAYVLGNAHIHAARRGRPIRPDAIDPLSSAANRQLVAQPHTWLLRIGWTLGLPSG